MRDTAHANTLLDHIVVFRQSADNMYRYEDDYVLATTRVGLQGAHLHMLTPRLRRLRLD